MNPEALPLAVEADFESLTAAAVEWALENTQGVDAESPEDEVCSHQSEPSAFQGEPHQAASPGEADPHLQGSALGTNPSAVVEPLRNSEEESALRGAAELLLGKRSREEGEGKDADPANKRMRTHREAKSTKAKRERRKKLRSNAADAVRPDVRPKVAEKYLRDQEEITTKLNAEQLPSARGAYTARVDAKSKGRKSPREKTIHDLIKEDGFAYKAWNGTINHPILDSLKRVIAVLIAKPKDPGYEAAHKRVFEKMKTAAERSEFTTEESTHRRGEFPAINVGISIGPGGKISNAASFKLWAPALHEHYRNYDQTLREKMPHLTKNFERSVFSSTAFNFGPKVRTRKHRDVLNLPYGLCAIHALGNYDHRKGGHLIIWDLKLIIEFPPGALILLPSATVAHSNSALQEGDQRASITQYTSGALFRYIDNGFLTDEGLKKKSRKEYERRYTEREGRWRQGVSYFSFYKGGKIVPS